MAAIQQDAITAAVVAALKAAPALAGVSVYEDDEFDGLPEDVSTALVVSFTGSRAAEIVASGLPNVWTTHLLITSVCRVNTRGANGRPAHVQANRAHEALAADAALAALVMTFDLQHIRPADPQRWDTRLGALDLAYVATHRGSADSLQ